MGDARPDRDNAVACLRRHWNVYATLTVTDNNGAIDTDTTSVTVSTASSTWARSIGCTNSDGGNGVAADTAGNIFVAARSAGA